MLTSPYTLNSNPKHRIRMTSTSSDQSAIQSRLRRLIGEKAGGKQQELAAKADIQPSMLSRLLSGSEPITRRYLYKIEKATGARLAWLELGVEPVYYPEGKIPERNESEIFEGQQLRAYLDRNNIAYSHLGDLLGKSKNTVQGYFKSESLSKANKEAILKALNAKPEQVFGGTFRNVVVMNSPAILDRTAKLLYWGQSKKETGPIRRVDVDNLNMVDVLRVPISARAGLGYQAYFNGSEYEREYVRISEDRLYPGIPREKHRIVEVNGDSMEPVMEHGYEMLAYELPQGHFPNYVKYIIVDFRDEVTIKVLAAVDYVAGNILLRSLNGGQEMRIPMDEVRQAFHVYDYYKAKL